MVAGYRRGVAQRVPSRSGRRRLGGEPGRSGALCIGPRPRRGLRGHLMALGKIEHDAIAVADLDAAIEHYRDIWGLEVSHRERVEDQGVEEAMLPLGESHLQLL